MRLIIPWRAIAVLLQTTQTQVRYLYYLKSAQSVPTQVEHLASDPRLPNLPVRIEVDEEKPGKWQQLVTSKVSQLGKPNSRIMTIFLDVYHREVLMYIDYMPFRQGSLKVVISVYPYLQKTPNFSRFYKKLGPFYKKLRCDKFGN